MIAPVGAINNEYEDSPNKAKDDERVNVERSADLLILGHTHPHFPIDPSHINVIENSNQEEIS